MASPAPNASLEAALVRFGQQQGISSDQEAQLRNAITSDSQLLGQLNTAAQAGHLRGFALPPAGSTTPNAVGLYDLQTGVVSLPAAAFQPSGTASSADLKAVMQVQEMTIRFGHNTYTDPPQPGAAAPPTTHPVSQDMLDSLQNTINGSPALAEQVKKAATTRDPGANPRAMLLENFDFVPANMHAGGTYSAGNHSMNLPVLGLQAKTAANPQGNFDPDDLTFVMGHEIQHGFNHPAKAQAGAAFAQQVGQVVGSSAVVHDYTAPVRSYVQAGRDDEAKAEIAGWNALLSRQQQTNPNVTLTDMLTLPSQAAKSRTQDFVEAGAVAGTTVAKTGLSFNSDNTLSATPANVAAMGQHYFNRPDPASALPGQHPVHIGESGKTDYTNYYGTGAIETVIQAERQHAQHHPGVVHKLTIDMAGIGLKENLMEQEGIKIQINKATPQPYYDSSQTPAAQGNFHHTQDGSVNPQYDHQHVPVAPAVTGSGANGRSNNGEIQEDRTQAFPARPVDALSPADRQLHQRMLELGRAHGLDEERSGNLAAQGLLAFKQDKLTGRADDVGIYGGKLMTTYFPFGRELAPNFHTPPLDVDAASKVPSQQTLQQVIQLDQQQVQQQSQARQQTGPVGPTM
ncbi:MAG: XVIPCD domain-containing protein [Lysobacter sp.]